MNTPPPNLFPAGESALNGEFCACARTEQGTLLQRLQRHVPLLGRVSLTLILFLVPATLIFHNFWAYSGAEQQQQMIHFMIPEKKVVGLCRFGDRHVIKGMRSCGYVSTDEWPSADVGTGDAAW